MYRIWLTLLFLALSGPLGAADTWVSFATTSTTAPDVENGLCYSDGRDIACDGAAGLLVTSGTVSFGAVSATTYYGDGSNLTGVTATAETDRVTSGTTAVIANSDSGYVSFTSSGVTTGHYSPGGILSAVGISTTDLTQVASLTVGIVGGNNILSFRNNAGNPSATIGFAAGNNTQVNIANYGGGSAAFQFYVGSSLSTSARMAVLSTTGLGVGAGINTPTSTLHVSGTSIVTSWTAINLAESAKAPLEVSGHTIISSTSRVPLWLTRSNAADHIVITFSNGADQTHMGMINSRGDLGLGGSSSGLNIGAPLIAYRTTGNVGVGLNMGTTTASATLHVSGTARVSSWTTIASTVTPTNALDVYGTVSATAFRGDGSQLTGISASVASETMSINDLLDASSTVASGNLFVGYLGGGQIVTGTGNTGLGVGALASATAAANSTAVGHNALSKATVGERNTAVGFGAMRDNTTGNYNTALGYHALRANLAGFGNVALGYQAGNSTTGSRNIIIGYNIEAPNPAAHYQLNIGDTIYGNTSTDYVGIGTATPTVSLEVSGTVSASAFVGDGSGLTGVAAGASDRIESDTTSIVADGSSDYISITNGGVTTGYLTNAGILVTPGISATTNRVSVTTLSVSQEATFNALTIRGYSGSTGGTLFGLSRSDMGYVGGNVNRILIGTAPATPVYLGSNGIVRLVVGSNGNVGIGEAFLSTTPSATLHVSGTVQVSSWTTIASTVTPSTALDVYGTVSATAFVGDGSQLTGISASVAPETISINDLSDASSTVASSNLFLGYLGGGQINTGTRNTGLGYGVLASATTSTDNAAVGTNALRWATTGGGNVAVGSAASSNLTTGGQNVAIGHNALLQVTSSDWNVAIGDNTLRRGNPAWSVAVGSRAMYNNAGTGSTAVGLNAGYGGGSAQGDRSVYLGAYSGLNITDGDRNITLGYQAGDSVTTGNDNVVIGYGADTQTPTDSGRLVIANLIYGIGLGASGTQISSGSLGIGTATPTATLDVAGDVSATGSLRVGSAACDGTRTGAIRVNPATGRLQLCRSL